ncbi:hypothetical protein E4U46_002476 [Claviceps purpurea]|nr:hypothetical protein E4U46_002476 [Claviceps purpurea]
MMHPHREDMQTNGPDSTDHTKNDGDGSEISLPKNNCPINDKAEQAGEKSSSSPESQKNGDSTPCAFPQFMQFPPELRYHIWTFYCPDLSTKARVLQFNFVRKTRLGLCVVPDQTMMDQTESLRIVLSTHSESRNLALRQYPDELAVIAGVADGIVRFRKETDIISLRDWSPDITSVEDWTPRGKKYFMPDFSDRIENLVLEPIQIPYRVSVFEAAPLLRLTFPNLRRLFRHNAFLAFVSSLKNWCFTDIAHSYVVETHKRANGKGFDSKFMFCWPDLDGFADFQKCSCSASERRDVTLERMKNAGLEVWPIVEFGSQAEINTYEKMRGFDYEEIHRNEKPVDPSYNPFDLTGYLPGDNDNDATEETDNDDDAIEEPDNDDDAIEEADNDDDDAIEEPDNDDDAIEEADNDDDDAIELGPQEDHYYEEFETIDDELEAFYRGLSEEQMMSYVKDVICCGYNEANSEIDVDGN